MAPHDKISRILNWVERTIQKPSVQCKEAVSREGSKKKSYNAINLLKHLEQHDKKYRELLEVEEHENSNKRSGEQNKGQPRIDETLQPNKSVWLLEQLLSW